METYSYTRNQAQEIASQSWTNDLYQWTGYANGTRSYTANGLNQYTIAAGDVFMNGIADLMRKEGTDV